MAGDLTPNSPWRKGKLAEVNARYARFLAGGFPVPGFGEGETLQCRNELDRTNWLGMLGMCVEAEAIGLGDELIPIGFRTTSNTAVVVSFAEAALILRGLRAWAAVAQANWWRLKDAVRDARTRAELDAINLDEGWP